jgi:hypothetical protein
MTRSCSAENQYVTLENKRKVEMSMHQHEDETNHEHEGHSTSKSHVLMMALCCILPLVAIVTFGSLSWKPLPAFLCCSPVPLIHVSNDVAKPAAWEKRSGRKAWTFKPVGKASRKN